MATPKSQSDEILDTIEHFFEASPDLEGCEVEFGKRRTGEEAGMNMMTITVDGTRLTLVVKTRR
jgi:hypothetical protein